MGVSPQRRDDWGFAYHVRPVLLELEGRRVAISPHETQLLLGELGRLPRARHQGAETVAGDLVHGLAAGCAVALDEEGRRCVLRSIEGLCVGRGLTSGLTKLRAELLRAATPVL
jgi:hypothetical protein